MKEFISCPNPACDSRMKWDKDDDEYSCGSCASVLTIPSASRTEGKAQGEVCLCDTCTLEGQCPTLAAGIRACYCNRYCKKVEVCKHEWGIDGAHNNENCKKCFKDKEVGDENA